MVPSSSYSAKTVFLSLPVALLLLSLCFFFLQTKEVWQRAGRERVRETLKVGGLILAGNTFPPHPVFVLALWKHLQTGGGGGERWGKRKKEENVDEDESMCVKRAVNLSDLGHRADVRSDHMLLQTINKTKKRLKIWLVYIMADYSRAHGKLGIFKLKFSKTVRFSPSPVGGAVNPEPSCNGLTHEISSGAENYYFIWM